MCVWAVTVGLFYSGFVIAGKAHLFGSQPSLSLLVTPVLFLLRHVKKMSSVKKDYKTRTLNRCPLKCWSLAFNFCTFICFHPFCFDVMFHSGFWVILHNTNFHALLILHMRPFHITTHCPFSFAAFLIVNRPKEGHVKSWVDIAWHPVWFYHMCLRWNVWFSFALYIYVYKWLVWSLFLFSYVHVLIGNDDFVKEMTHQWCYRIIPISTAAELIGALRVMKTKIKRDWRQTGSTWDIRLWSARETPNVSNYSSDRAGDSVYNMQRV